ncbi:hypothetical protein R3I93_005322 [Phoxinus phoxinus]
MRVAG